MKIPFTMIDELLGEISFEPLNLENHIQQVHTWTTAKHASFWGMQGYNQQQVFEFYKDLEQGKYTDTFIGSVAGEPCFLVELYDPRLDQVGKHYDVQIGDKGMHILIAATENLSQVLLMLCLSRYCTLCFKIRVSHELLSSPTTAITKSIDSTSERDFNTLNAFKWVTS